MKKVIRRVIKIITCCVVFAASLIISSYIMNSGNMDMTTELTESELPVVSFRYAGNVINCLHGYKNRMKEAYMRETITPLEQGRSVSLSVRRYGARVSRLYYEVRSLDGERLIENTQLFNYVEKDDEITSTFSIKDLIQEEEMYTLVVILELESGEKVYYYTRIMQAYDYYTAEKLAYALDFSEKTFDKEEAKTLVKYLEPDRDKENNDFHHVTIHSSFDQVSWGTLPVKRMNPPQLMIKELAKQTASIELDYIVSVSEGKQTNEYRVKEYFRVRYGTERMYLLQYERTMEEYFDENGEDTYTEDQIRLGINGREIEFVESDDSNLFGFVVNDVLYAYNLTDNKMTRIFGFGANHIGDIRADYDANDIKILSIDEAGSVTFMVYGYMNRGTREGSVGVLVYYYNSMFNTIEELVYIPYSGSYEMLKSGLSQLTYLNKEGDLYLYLCGSICSVNVNTRELSVIAQNAFADSFQVSESNVMLVWQDGNSLYDCDRLILMNLSTKQRTAVIADYGKRVLPIGFMGEDLIYGICYADDIYMDGMGSVVFPMYELKIQDEFGKVFKNYYQENMFITDCSITDNMISLERITRDPDTGIFTETSEDTILNNTEAVTGKNLIETYDAGQYETAVRIAVKKAYDAESMKYLNPKEVIYEGNREIVIEPLASQDNYYVYMIDGSIHTFGNPADAVQEAYENSATVIGEDGKEIWTKGNRSTRNQIMAITGTAADEDKNSLLICLDTILTYEGVNADTAELLGMNSIPNILQNNLPNVDVLDLTGCSLDSVLYYVNQDIPVLALLDDGQAVLVIGFNELNIVVMNPEEGTVYKMGMNDSKDWFDCNNNRFVTYIRKNDK